MKTLQENVCKKAIWHFNTCNKSDIVHLSALHDLWYYLGLWSQGRHSTQFHLVLCQPFNNTLCTINTPLVPQIHLCATNTALVT